MVARDGDPLTRFATLTTLSRKGRGTGTDPLPSRERVPEVRRRVRGITRHSVEGSHKLIFACRTQVMLRQAGGSIFQTGMIAEPWYTRSNPNSDCDTV